MILLTFGQRLRQARKEKQLTQKELAAKINAAHNSISNWENDQNMPDPNTIQNLCLALDVQPNFFFSVDPFLPPSIENSCVSDTVFRLRELREQRGLNMKEVARSLNIPYTTYVNYEKCLRKPTYEVLIQLADFFESSVDYLIGRSTTNKNTDEMKMSVAEIARIIKKARLDAGLTQKTVADILGITYQAISNYERGTNRIDTITLTKLCKIYGIQISDFLITPSCGVIAMSTNDLSEKIRYLRNKHGLTLEQVSQQVGVGKSTVRKWETGIITNMRRDKIDKLAAALHTSPGYLMGWESTECSSISPNMSDEEITLIKKYRHLDERGKSSVLTILNHEYDSLPVDKTFSSPKKHR